MLFAFFIAINEVIKREEKQQKKREKEEDLPTRKILNWTEKMQAALNRVKIIIMQHFVKLYDRIWVSQSIKIKLFLNFCDNKIKF